MTPWRKTWLGAVAMVSTIALVVAIWGAVQGTDEGIAVFYVALVVSGIFDTLIAAFFIPHVHDNKRLGQWKILWIALLGIPYITVAPIYWAIYVLPEKPGDSATGEPAAGQGGA